MKSLAATIRTDRVGKGGAPLPLIPLSSCLDMVRKTLGQHDIPTLQTIVIGLAGLSRRGNRVGLHLSSGCWRCLRYNRHRWQLL